MGMITGDLNHGLTTTIMFTFIPYCVLVTYRDKRKDQSEKQIERAISTYAWLDSEYLI